MEDPNIPVASIYSKKYTQKYERISREFKGGNAVFTNPPAPIKCAGAPLKIMYLSEEKWRKSGVRKDTKIEYNSALGTIFGVKKYADVLVKLTQKKDIAVNYKNKLIEVRGKERVAIFQDIETGAQKEVKFDILHAVPTMSPPKLLRESKSLVDAAGYVDVDKHTLRSNKFPNVWGVGDCTNTPNSKTAAAIIQQVPVLSHNLLEIWRDKAEKPKLAQYNGYSSCPIFTGDKKILCAEFLYGGTVDETIPFLQNSPSWIFYLMKVYIFRWSYFHLMPKGKWNGRYLWTKPPLKIVDTAVVE